MLLRSCGQCAANHTYALGASVCVRCQSTNAGLVTALFLVGWLVVLGLHYLSQSASGEVRLLPPFTPANCCRPVCIAVRSIMHVCARFAFQVKILLFFLSSARLIAGPNNEFLSWLGLFEQSTDQR